MEAEILFEVFTEKRLQRTAGNSSQKKCKHKFTLIGRKLKLWALLTCNKEILYYFYRIITSQS